jgi:hypothetical protein
VGTGYQPSTENENFIHFVYSLNMRCVMRDT